MSIHKLEVEAKRDLLHAATLNQALVGRQPNFIAFFNFFYYIIFVVSIFYVLGAWKAKVLEG